MRLVRWSATGPVHGLKDFAPGSAKEGVLETLCGSFPDPGPSWRAVFDGETSLVTCRVCLRSIAKIAGTETCNACGSESLFSGYFDADDLAVDNSIDNPTADPAVRWTTFCNDCGEELL